MKKESTAVLLRIFIGESDKYKGKNLYQYLVEFLRKNHYSGITVLRGISGFGKASKVHTSDLLELSSDLPIVIEIVDSEEKIEELKKLFEESDLIGSALITQENVKIIQYGTNE
jgi:PII-like signaling protein